MLRPEAREHVARGCFAHGVIRAAPSVPAFGVAFAGKRDAESALSDSRFVFVGQQARVAHSEYAAVERCGRERVHGRREEDVFASGSQVRFIAREAVKRGVAAREVRRHAALPSPFAGQSVLRDEVVRRPVERRVIDHACPLVDVAEPVRC